jgi:3-hydroxy-9,10-secoandrosta-1,3,5(10)-triene-9,17-dione monooxygenase
MGLKGTGSKDVAVEDVFVPEEMTLAAADMKGGPTPGSRVNPNPLYQIPVFAMFPYVLSGVALGNAQAAVDGFIANTRSRVSRYSGAKVGDFQSTQIKIGEAGAKVDAARRVMRQICEEAMDDATHGRVPTMLEKTRFRRDGAFSVKLCTEAVDQLFAAVGAGGLYSSNPVQRRFRDAHAIAAHIAFNTDMAGGTYGRVALGLDPDNPTL